MNGMDRKKTKSDMTVKAAVQLAAPHTWPASVLPVLLGSALAFAEGAAPEPLCLLLTLATGVLLQSAVNTLNDYRDFACGLDTAENCDDPTDAALIYEGVGPRAVLFFGMLLLACAALTGALLIFLHGPDLLIYGAVALLAIFLYTMPGISFSSLPLGELLSGIAMGGALTCAAFRIQAGTFDPAVMPFCLPAILTVAGIMLTNNISDTEKDAEGGRRTFAVCLGRKAARAVLRLMIVAAVAAVAVAAFIRFPGGIAVIPVTVVAVALCSGPLFRGPVNREDRIASMRSILSSHNGIITSYIAVIILHRLAL